MQAQLTNNYLYEHCFQERRHPPLSLVAYYILCTRSKNSDTSIVHTSAQLKTRNMKQQNPKCLKRLSIPKN